MMRQRLLSASLGLFAYASSRGADGARFTFWKWRIRKGSRVKQQGRGATPIQRATMRYAILFIPVLSQALTLALTGPC